MVSAARRTAFLLFMPVITAEFLTGSTPLPSLLDPLTLPLLLGLYGLGAILVRELAAAWRKGWPTIMVLGAAYGVIEEALDVKSWFNPSWPALGRLATYGRFLGVNTVWAVELTVFHAVFSITIPIVLTRLLFPGEDGTRWFRTRTLVAIAVIFVGVVTFGFAFFPYSPPPVQYLAALGFVALLVWMAHRLPSSLPGTRSASTKGFLRLVVVGFVFSLCFFLIFWVVPATSVPPPVDLFLVFLLGAFACRFFVRRSFSALQLFYLVAGGLAPLILVAVLSMSLAEGPPIVAVAYTLALLAIGRRVAGRTTDQKYASEDGRGLLGFSGSALPIRHRRGHACQVPLGHLT